MKPHLLALFCCVAAAAGRAAPPLGLSPGESLRYRVSWLILPGAGEITIRAKSSSDPAGTPLMHVVTHTATRGLARLVLPFDADADSLFDRATGRLVWLGESSDTRGRHRAHNVAVRDDHGRPSYFYQAPGEPARALPVPPGSYPTDLITCLVQAGTWGLRPGQTHDAVVLFEDEVYLLTVHALGYETVETSLGDFKALVLEPRMEKTPPQGMFKRGSTVRVWIAQDARHLPVRFKVQFSFGSGIATLAADEPAR